MHQMKHYQQEFLQREQDLTKPLEDADRNFLKNHVHIYRFYFVTSVLVILMSIVLVVFIADYDRLKVSVTGLTITKIPWV